MQKVEDGGWDKGKMEKGAAGCTRGLREALAVTAGVQQWMTLSRPSVTCAGVEVASGNAL